MLTSCVALLMACIGLTLYDIAAFRDSMEQRLTTLGVVLGANSTAALEFNDTSVAADVLAALRAEPHVVAACLYKDGVVFATYQRTGNSQQFPPFRSQVEGHQFTSDRLTLFHRIRQHKELVGAIYLESDLDALGAGLRQYISIGGAMMLVAALVAFLMSAWLQRFVSSPILQLVQATASVSQKKDYSVRVPSVTGDELGQLIDAFNDMLGQIQMRDAAAQQAQENLEKRVLERTTELQQQISRMSLLNQIARAVVEGQDLAAIFLVLLRGLENHFSIDYGGVYLFDPLRDCLIVAAHGPKSEELANALGEQPGQPHLLDVQLMGSLLSGERRSWTGSDENDVRLSEYLKSAGLSSGVILPLLAERKLLGAMILARRTTEAFCSRDLEFFDVVGEQVALAARQAQLHSELRKAYEELRTTQQTALQQERLKALGQMASGIAHDINNALVPVLLGSDLMLTAPMNLSTQSRRIVEGIKTASGDIANTVTRLKDFYRQRHHQEAVSEVDLTAVVQEATELTRPRWRDIPQQRGVVVNLKTELAPDLPRLMGNESEIRQALTNLILNAVDAMPQGGTLILRSSFAEKPISKDSQPRATAVCLEVIDTGVGMDEETRRRCLEPFFSTKGVRGTGMGLAMVYGVMERHKGRIEIETAISHGTTMRLLFPVKPISTQSAAARSKSGPPTASMRILCIDDEPLVLQVVTGVLSQLGHEVVSKESGMAGLEAFRLALAENTPFDALITDLGMPEMDGCAVANAAKRIAPNIPVILLTGWGIFMNSEGDKPKSVDCIISKPPSVADLSEGLRQVTKCE